jgi:murein DD-endopeptidase MepM/ murein hydrolase activator NlpD
MLENKSYNTIKDSLNDKVTFYKFMPSINPIKINDISKISESKFGYRFHPILHRILFHEGIDITAPTGTEVYATADGYISGIFYSNEGYGNYIEIDHKNGYKTIYAHLSKILVKMNQYVKRKDLIGLVGNTGLSTGPHLHWEIRLNNTPVNPENYMGDIFSYIIEKDTIN